MSIEYIEIFYIPQPELGESTCKRIYHLVTIGDGRIVKAIPSKHFLLIIFLFPGIARLRYPSTSSLQKPVNSLWYTQIALMHSLHWIIHVYARGHNIQQQALTQTTFTSTICIFEFPEYSFHAFEWMFCFALLRLRLWPLSQQQVLVLSFNQTEFDLEHWNGGRESSYIQLCVLFCCTSHRHSYTYTHIYWYTINTLLKINYIFY